MILRDKDKNKIDIKLDNENKIDMVKELNNYSFVPSSKTTNGQNFLGEWKDIDPGLFKDNFNKKKAFEYARINHGINPLNTQNYNPLGNVVINGSIIALGVISTIKFIKNVRSTMIWIKDGTDFNKTDNSNRHMYFKYSDGEHDSIYGRINRPKYISNPIGYNSPTEMKISLIGSGIIALGTLVFASTCVIPFIKSIFGKNGLIRKPNFDDLHPQILIPKYVSSEFGTNGTNLEGTWFRTTKETQNAINNYTKTKIV